MRDKAVHGPHPTAQPEPRTARPRAQPALARGVQPPAQLARMAEPARQGARRLARPGRARHRHEQPTASYRNSIASKLAPCMLSLYPTREVKLGGVHTSKCVSGGGRSLLKAGFAPDLVCREAPPPHCPPRRVSRSRQVGLRITRLQRHEVRGRGNREQAYLKPGEWKA